jgi:hypothetical protein
MATPKQSFIRLPKVGEISTSSLIFKLIDMTKFRIALNNQ